jgi:DNA adenine methylase
MNSKNKNKIVNDINDDIISLYKNIDLDFIETLKGYFIDKSKEDYYKNRELFNTTSDIRLKSLLFVYLNRHCFNGLCRYNKSGEYNVPVGKHASIYFPEKEMLDFIKLKTNVRFYNKSFEDIFRFCEKDSVVYCDPPYDPITETSFTDYDKSGFGKKQQEVLADLVMSSPCKVVSSNHDTEYIRSLYNGCIFKPISVMRSISSGKRRTVGEVLIIKQ